MTPSQCLDKIGKISTCITHSLNTKSIFQSLNEKLSNFVASSKMLLELGKTDRFCKLKSIEDILAVLADFYGKVAVFNCNVIAKVQIYIFSIPKNASFKVW